MTDWPSQVHPSRTFRETRRVTPGGVPICCTKSDDNLARKAGKEFTKHGHVTSRALPRHVDRPGRHDMPIDYRPEPERYEPDDLSQLLTVLTPTVPDRSGQLA